MTAEIFLFLFCQMFLVGLSFSVRIQSTLSVLLYIDENYCHEYTYTVVAFATIHMPTPCVVPWIMIRRRLCSPGA